MLGQMIWLPRSNEAWFEVREGDFVWFLDAEAAKWYSCFRLPRPRL